MRERWDRGSLVQLAVTIALLAAVLSGFARFVSWVEQRPGAVLADPILARLAPRDLTWATFTLIYAGIVAGAASLARRPQRLLAGAQGYAAMVLVRAAAMWLVPLDPPPGMIPLQDPFVRLLGPGQPLTRDLFFSGHTASLLIVFLAAPSRGLKALFLASAAGVAACVLVQHVHYSIDVLAAPPFAYAGWRTALLVRARLGLPPL
jgi:hypothetical protein